MPTPRRSGWILAILYAALVTFPHEQVQTVVNGIAARMGHAHFYIMMGGLAIAGVAALTVLLTIYLRNWTVAVFWLITLVLIFLTWRILTFNNSELVHYPQYLPLGAFLVFLTGSPVEALCWIVLTGGLDECFQYWGLHATWNVPFDFNDVYMDLLGGALGVVLYLAFRPLPPAPKLRPGLFVILGLTVSGFALWCLGLMQIYQSPAPHWFALSRMTPRAFWFQDPTWGPHTTHILTPIEGPTLILATLALFSLLEHRLSRTGPRPVPSQS